MEYTEFWDFMVLLLGLLPRSTSCASIITRVCIYRLVDRGRLMFMKLMKLTTITAHPAVAKLLTVCGKIASSLSK